MDQRPRRKYTVSERVLAASRANLARANAAPKEARYRSTERRRAASAVSLAKARAARRCAGVRSRSIEESLERAGESAEVWAALRERFEKLFGAACDAGTARALAEVAWRRFRAWRQRERRENLAFYRRLDQAARQTASARLGRDAALELARDFGAVFSDPRRLAHDLGSLWRRFNDLIENYHFTHYATEYDRPLTSVGRVVELLERAPELLGNPWARPLDKETPAATVSASSDRAPFCEENSTVNSEGESTATGKLPHGAKENSPVVLPADYDEHFARLRAVFHADEQEDGVLAERVERLAAATWMRLRLPGQLAQIELERLMAAFPPEGITPDPTVATVSDLRDRGPFRGDKPTVNSDGDLTVATTPSGEDAGDDIDKEYIDDNTDNRDYTDHAVLPANLPAYALARQATDALLAALAEPKAILMVVAEAGDVVSGALREWLDAAFGREVSEAFAPPGEPSDATGLATTCVRARLRPCR